MNDEQRLGEVRRAFQELLELPSGSSISLRGLFGVDMSRLTWTRVLIRRVIDLGLIELAQPQGPSERGRPRLFLAPTAELERYTQDDALLSDLIWPHRGADHMFDPGMIQPSYRGHIEDSEIDDAAPQPLEGSSEMPGADADPTEDAPLEEVVKATLKICYATLENVAYMRTRIEAIEKTLKDLNEVWE